MLNSTPTYQLTIAIVLYNNEEAMLRKAIESCLFTKLHIHLYLVDNSATNKLQTLALLDDRISYYFNGSNIGFGAGHNIAIRQAIHKSEFHLVLNPDVYFTSGILEAMYAYMQQHPEIGILSPKVYYPDGKLQYLCRKLPAPLDIILKRAVPSFILTLFRKRVAAYEFKNRDYNSVMDVPSLSGCFMFVRCEVFRKAGMFDEKFFMYMEDFDFTRRTSKYYRTVYFPDVFIFHQYAKESATNKKLLIVAIKSTIYYFNKWGWIIDKERKKINANKS